MIAMKLLNLILCVIFVFTKRFVTSQVHLNGCYTPSGDIGICTSLKLCPQVVNLFTRMPQNTATQYSKALQRSCGNRISFDNYPIVCCTEIHAGIPNNNNNNPRQNPDRDTFTLPSSTTEKIDEAKILSHTTPRSEGSDNVCQGPTGDIGFCISIHNCTNLLDRIRATPNDENLKSELRSSNTICGSKDMNVCCPVTNSKSRAVNTGETPRRLPTEDEGCGFVRQATGKIVGGRESEIGDWPWIALIGYNAYSLNPFRCGGSLVTAKHVITAAHCITRDLSFVRLGEHDLSTQSETKHLDVDVDKVKISYYDMQYVN
ncbi:phenoloxidase-activating enzyme-like [Teleopsis dalmanni]|uniref:phenoloxidase-activating enzyme-like n=1 Tax=Teleopsis dalmanni TaxID=139649 RepID=UPI0018CF8A6D|nr:phenoloxidase-activating enzyme-like [Teleopsis dalmanni]